MSRRPACRTVTARACSWERIFERGLGRRRLIWVEVAYRATALLAWISTHLPRRGLRLEVVGRDAHVKGFEVQPRRRVVERTFGWLNKCRRLRKDYEHHTTNSEAMIRVASIALMLRRLTSKPAF